MKKTLLWGALSTILCSQVQADTQAAPNPAALPPTTQTAPATQPAETTPALQTTAPATPAMPTTEAINCNYKIPASITKIDPSLVLSWAEKATTQAFDFSPATLDSQLTQLQVCFTEPGWTGFNTALQKSGNLEAIKSQKLTVSSQLDGTAKIVDSKENQWKLTLPVQVVYQNDKEKVTQLLDVNLTVGRKISGDLGIMQMVATPRATVTLQEQNSNTTPTATTPVVPATPATTPTPAPAEVTPPPTANPTPAPAVP